MTVKRTTALESLKREIGNLKLDDALLFLNRILAAGREMNSDPELEPVLRARSGRAPAFFVHFLAKQLLLEASVLGVNLLDGSRFVRLMDRYFELEDPISEDPTWPTADPSGFLERFLSQQIAAQRRDYIQQFGLGLRLFRDVGPVQAQNATYDIGADLEKELGMPIEEFMALGQCCSAAQQAVYFGLPRRGTFTGKLFDILVSQGHKFPRPDVWPRFLSRVSADRDCFRQVCARPQYQVRDARYTQFEFNPLARYPVSKLDADRYIAVDPLLIYERTTFGLFYDLFERDGLPFSNRFGYVFDRFVGNLLESACPKESLWWEADQTRPKPKNPGKVADWAYQGNQSLVLFECKSLRPSLELVTYGLEESLQKVRKRIVSAVTQLTEHADSIRAGKWMMAGLHPPKAALGVIVTYGHINTANGKFTRDRVNEALAAGGVQPIPFVVLSIEDLDQVIRLVELGNPLDQVVTTLTAATAEGSFNPLQRYTTTFEGQRSSSNFSFDRSKELIEQIRPETCSG